MSQSHPYRRGVVKAQDLTLGRVRVQFPDLDQSASYWLPVLQARTQSAKSWHLPAIGEQVACLMDEHFEDGVVLGSIFSNADPPPPGLGQGQIHYLAEDGAVFDYDPVAHALTITLPSGASLAIAVSGGTVSINANTITLAGGTVGVARLGDTTTCPAGAGTITGASTKVKAG